jgi:hypothetical protein
MQINNVVSVLEIEDWYNAEDNPGYTTDPYMIKCAVQKSAYCCPEDVKEDGGRPVKRKVRVIIAVEEV